MGLFSWKFINNRFDFILIFNIKQSLIQNLSKSKKELAVKLEIDTENASKITDLLIKEEIELEKLTLEQIKAEIEIIKDFLEVFQQQKIELQQEIELYEEDWAEYEEEELQGINTAIERMLNYLDRLIDFESFAE